jgi:hypothetical protein
MNEKKSPEGAPEWTEAVPKKVFMNLKQRGDIYWFWLERWQLIQGAAQPASPASLCSFSRDFVKPADWSSSFRSGSTSEIDTRC